MPHHSLCSVNKVKHSGSDFICEEFSARVKMVDNCILCSSGYFHPLFLGLFIFGGNVMCEWNGSYPV